MKRYSYLILALALHTTLTGCTKPESEPVSPTPEPTHAEAPKSAADDETQFSESGTQTTLPPIALDPFTVDSLHIGDLALGHFNLYVKGGEPAAVRAWVGDEAATNVVVTKAEFEFDHHCAHIEVPSPLPAEAKLWVEIETADGARLKGSTPVQ